MKSQNEWPITIAAPNCTNLGTSICFHLRRKANLSACDEYSSVTRFIKRSFARDFLLSNESELSSFVLRFPETCGINLSLALLV